MANIGFAGCSAGNRRLVEMQNMMILDDNHIQTAYGIFGAVSSYRVYDTGELRSVMLLDKNVIATHAGELIPAYTENKRRKIKPAVQFF